MNTKEYKTFLNDCKDSIDEKPLNLSFDDFDDLSHSVFSNPQKIKQKASEIRKKFIDNIDENMLNISNRNKKEEKVNLILEAAEENTKAKKFTFKL